MAAILVEGSVEIFFIARIDRLEFTAEPAMRIDDEAAVALGAALVKRFGDHLAVGIAESGRRIAGSGAAAARIQNRPAQDRDGEQDSEDQNNIIAFTVCYDNVPI